MDIYKLTAAEIDEMMEEIMSTDRTCEDNNPLHVNVEKDALTENERTSERQHDAANYKKVNALKWTKNKEDIVIDEDGDVHCKNWGKYYIKGNGTTPEGIRLTIEVINRYITECVKDKAFRNFDFIEMIEKD